MARPVPSTFADRRALALLVPMWTLVAYGCGSPSGSPRDLAPYVSIGAPLGGAAITQGQSVTFAAEGTGGNPPLTYAWDFDGAAPATTVQNPGPVTFSAPGVFTVGVTVTDADGDRATDSVAVDVAPAPQATIELPATSVSVWQGDSLAFRGAGSGGRPPLAYAWDFHGAAPAASVAEPGPIAMEVLGTFTVTFSVTDLDQAVASRSVEVEVKFAPLAVTSVSPSSGTVSGGTRIQIAGDGFRPGAQVSVGGAPCLDVVRTGRTSLSCTTSPSAAPGSVAVTVTNPGGSTVALAGGFAYDARGSFRAVGQRLPSESASGKRAGILVDVDGDGHLDYFQTGWDGAGAFAWLQLGDVVNGSAWFTSAPQDLPAEPPSADGMPYFAVASADLNHDGHPDLIFLQDAHLVTYLSDGGGHFTRSAVVLCGVRDGQGVLQPQSASARALAVADLDGDGFPDVAVARGPSTESCWNGAAQVEHSGAILLRNDGSGGFTASYTAFPDIAADSMAIVAADLDGDGDQDVFVVNGSNQRSRLYLNDGYGHFADFTSSNLPSVTGNGRAAAVGDVNGDGRLDIVIGYDGQQTRIWLGMLMGVFADVTATNFPSGSDATERVWLVDYDGDGDLDLFTLKVPTAGAPQPMRVHRNNGTGVFSTDRASSVLPPVLGESLVDVAFGDVNGDGRPDMLWIQEGRQNRLLVNDGAGGFVRRTIADVPESSWSEEAAVVGDFDGDGDLDVVLCGRGGSRPRLLLNDGAGSLLDATAARMPDVAFDCNDVAAADVDGDGDLDLLFAVATDPGTTPSGASGAGVYLFVNDGSGLFADATASRLPAGAANRDARPLSIEPIDYDRDGDLDLLVGWQFGGGSEQQIRLWQNGGVSTGVFVDVTAGAGLETPGCNLDSAGLGVPMDIQVADLDGDGWPDVFVARTGGGGGPGCGTFGNMVFVNRHDGTFADRTATALPTLASGRRATVFDANGDGLPDVYVSNLADDRLYLNAGGGVFVDATLSNVPRQGETVAAVAVDADRDGRLDLVLVKTGGARPRLLLNVGQGAFLDYTDLKMEWADDDGRNAIGADLDLDGKVELLYLTDGQLRLYRQRP